MDARQVGPKCCAVILAGGRNTRMQGRNKAFLTIDGRTLLDRLLETLQPIFQEILLVTRQPECYAQYPIKVVEDIFQARSSLTGIHAGLTHAESNHAFMVPCDAPLLKPNLVRLLLSETDLSVDAVVPFLNGYYEPLCAIYAKGCIPPIEEQLARGDYQIMRFFERVRLKIVEGEKIKAVDPQLHSFLNVNTPEAYDELKKIMEKR